MHYSNVIRNRCIRHKSTFLAEGWANGHDPTDNDFTLPKKIFPPHLACKLRERNHSFGKVSKLKPWSSEQICMMKYIEHTVKRLLSCSKWTSSAASSTRKLHNGCAEWTASDVKAWTTLEPFKLQE
ncbi:uncharacterized protein LOC131432750 [Malaya genurostris]|uniref:uncharacterized protein LOC131432750 n=1 Tax=Malaya genurostris TaxID=325434 RepID=UPI0026F3A7BB|nr:uncharacterized protein LOC131432750 [Malaya genurostris]